MLMEAFREYRSRKEREFAEQKQIRLDLRLGTYYANPFLLQVFFEQIDRYVH